nr:hypothetical protein [Bacteroides faecichinchillae]
MQTVVVDDKDALGQRECRPQCRCLVFYPFIGNRQWQQYPESASMPGFAFDIYFST